MKLICRWMVTNMEDGFYKIKRIVRDLEKKQSHDLEIRLLQELAESAVAYKNHLINIRKTNENTNNINNLNIKTEKISEEVFLYKAVMVRNYYEGDYLERFSKIRTSDLKTSSAFNIHNKFWQAHEVLGGNIFASLPLALINHGQSSALQHLNWDPVKVDVYEIIMKSQPKPTKVQIINAVAKMFDHYLLVKEVYGNVFMILHYKI